MRFSTWLASAILMFMAGTTWSQCENLFFTEAAEGSSNNKYLEIYNPTDAEISLDSYAYPSVANAPDVPGEYEYWNDFDAGASIAPGDVYVIAHGSADPTILAEADETHNFLSNGDDGYMLVMGTPGDFIQLDAVGDWNGDPGSGWDVAGVTEATKDHTIVRKSSVGSGNGGDWSTSAGTDAENSEWIVLELNDWTNLAMHSFDGCGAAVLGCTNANATNYNADATQDDGSCMFDNACNVDGVVVEASSFAYNPANLSIEPGQTVVWSNLGGNHDVNGDIDSQTGLSFGNPEAFSLAAVAGDPAGVCIGSYTFNTPGVYTYDCSIGSHAALGMVATITVGTGGCTNAAASNYNPAADYDDDSCLVVELTSIATIQQGQETGIFADSVVVTRGIVTGVYGSNVSIQDGTGAYSGLWLFSPDVPVQVGDEVEVTGAVSEYFDKTQIGTPATLILSQGNALPAAEMLTTADASAEQWEGVLVEVTGFVTNADAGFGEWALSDGSGDLRVDDAGYDAIDAGLVALGNQLQLTGALDYSFSNFKVQPREAGDALLFGCTNSGASNYNSLASIEDGSCDVEASECSLFISEWAEGSSNNKYIELFNPTSAPIFLDEYLMAKCVNGCTSPDYYTNFPIGAQVQPGGIYILAHGSADSLILAVADMIWDGAPGIGNGDDATFLAKISSTDTTIVDAVGLFGPDPGNGWNVAGVTTATQNHTLVRKDDVSRGNGGDWTASAGTNPIDSEWIVLDNNDWSDLDVHTFSGACLADNSGCTNEDALNYDPNATEDDGNCIFISNLTIQDINESGFVGNVITSGTVTATFSYSSAFNGPSYVIQSGQGANAGLWVNGAHDGNVGDAVQITGSVELITGLHDRRQITPSDVLVLSVDNALPTPEVLAPGEIDNDQWSGVLVEMTGEASAFLGFGEWSVSDGEQSSGVDDLGFDAIDDSLMLDGMASPLVELGRNYRVTGPNLNSFGTWKLCPRDSADVIRIGCQDPSFPNYDPLASEDDGSCANIPGCTNESADNYNPEATADDGTCVITGCTDELALNYNPDANNADNGSCYFTLPNVIINEIHYNPCSSQGGDALYEFVELLNIGDQTADLSGFEFFNEAGGAVQLALSFPEGSMMAAGEFILIVVNDSIAQSDYAPSGTQIFEVGAGMGFGNSGEALALEDGFGNTVNAVTYDDAGGWPSSPQSFYGVNYINSPNGGCASLEYIPEALAAFLADPLGNGNDNPGNWQASWIDNGTPGAANSSAFGCNDPSACNFNANAILGDESQCTFDCAGCTYPNADNFTVGATQDDGSCQFTVANDCPADLNLDGAVTTADLLVFLVDFGSSCD